MVSHKIKRSRNASARGFPGPIIMCPCQGASSRIQGAALSVGPYARRSDGGLIGAGTVERRSDGVERGRAVGRCVRVWEKNLHLDRILDLRAETREQMSRCW